MSDLPRVRRTFIDGRFGQVHCRIAAPEEPSRLPLVCLHMSPKSGRSYEDILPELARERIVIAPDYPGHGESDKPPPDPHVSVADFAETAWQCVDALCPGRVHLLGYHTGSMVAVEAATARPDDVASVVNISAPLFTREELESLNGFFEPIPIDEAGNRFRIMWERVLEYRGPGMTLEMAADSFAENLRAGDDYEWGHRAAFAYGETYHERLVALELPVFVMNPNDDCYEVSKRVDPLLRDGFRRDYDEWGHGFLTVHAAAAATDITEFINQAETNDRLA